MPVLDGDLAGEQRAAAGVAVVEDLEEVVPSLSRERSEPPVVEDEEPRPSEPLDDLGIRPVCPSVGPSPLNSLFLFFTGTAGQWRPM